MEKRQFGNKNEYLSILGLGGIVIKGLDKYSVDSIVSDAVSEGINYFDVAPGYGDAEELLGPSLKKYRLNSFLACKTNKRTEKESTEELYNSLNLLKTDYLDLYQLHGMKTDDDFEKVRAYYNCPSECKYHCFLHLHITLVIHLYYLCRDVFKKY